MQYFLHKEIRNIFRNILTFLSLEFKVIFIYSKYFVDQAYLNFHFLFLILR